MLIKIIRLLSGKKRYLPFIVILYLVIAALDIISLALFSAAVSCVQDCAALNRNGSVLNDLIMSIYSSYSAAYFLILIFFFWIEVCVFMGASALIIIYYISVEKLLKLKLLLSAEGFTVDQTQLKSAKEMVMSVNQFKRSI